jgi:hypothetical protein
VKSISIALSGGGHRATLFTLGALMYVVDAGRAKDTTSISSVSGGSLTNGMVAQALEFQNADRAAFDEKVVKPLGGQIAQRGTLFVPLLTKLYLALLILSLPAAFLPIWFLDAGGWVKALVTIALLIVWGWLLGNRGWVVGQAFRSTLFAPGGKTTLLKDVSRETCHVICATELRSSQAMYFSPEFVYTHAFRDGEPDGMPLYQAVQASAAFPIGFPPARFPAGRHRFKIPDPPSQLILTDGGVYDNMGDQWARGFRNRAAGWHWLANAEKPPDQLVVVNASARVPWTPFKWGWIPLVGEVLAFFRIIGIMYINTTNTRRQEIVRSYDPTAPEHKSDLPGALVQIAQSPFTVADAFARSSDAAVAARAKVVTSALDPDTRDAWQQTADKNAAVSTNLSKLGTEASASLLRHGYVTAMCNLHVVFGDWPLLAIPTVDRFQQLVSAPRKGGG